MQPAVMPPAAKAQQCDLAAGAAMTAAATEESLPVAAALAAAVARFPAPAAAVTAAPLAKALAPAAGPSAVTKKHAAPPPPPPPPPPQKPPRSKAGIVVALGLAALVGVYLIGKPSKKEDACDQALNQSAALLAGGDAAGARGQMVLAMASCSGEARVKAGKLQAAADKAVAAQAQCKRSFRRIGSQISEHRLQSARGTLDQLGTACAASLQGKGLRSQIETGQAAATAAEAELRKQLAEGDLKAARAAFDQVIAINREHPDLSALRQELAAGVKALGSAPSMNAPTVTTTATATPRETQREPPQAARQQPTVTAAPSTPNPQAEMAQSFLRDAEAAMSQLKFDAAKTYVESARRIDPGNPQAAMLARRIKEHELQYLKEETSIK